MSSTDSLYHMLNVSQCDVEQTITKCFITYFMMYNVNMTHQLTLEMRDSNNMPLERFSILVHCLINGKHGCDKKY